MLTEQESQNLMNKFIQLREDTEKLDDPKLMNEFRKHERICIEKFNYLITMKTNRYKAFSNYDDLNQEGMEALVKAMKNYNPSLGSFFWWAHKYIDTRISRSANLHTTIRFPLKVAKEQTPHKESVMPNLIEETYCPDKQVENLQVSKSISDAMTHLTDKQKELLGLAYGFEGDKPMSINKICKKMSISRSACIKELNWAVSKLKDNIKL